MEARHVHSVYNTIARSFDRTRVCYWTQVRLFLDQLPTGGLVLDNGCGNGKYLPYRKDLEMIGFDPCKALLEICKTKHPGKVVQGNGLALPFRNNLFDAAISVAVLHHLSTHEMRVQFLKEMIRSMKPGGRGLVTVWATEQERPTLLTKWEKLETPNDYLVPWCHSDGTCLAKRYYHLFDRQEIMEQFQSLQMISIETILYEKSNWCVLFKKKETSEGLSSLHI